VRAAEGRGRSTGNPRCVRIFSTTARSSIPVDGGAVVKLDLLSVTVEDDDGLQLSVVVQDTGRPVIAPGEHFGNLYYTSASLGAGQYFAAIIRAAVS
jgi:hypothetical protein